MVFAMPSFLQCALALLDVYVVQLASPPNCKSKFHLNFTYAAKTRTGRVELVDNSLHNKNKRQD